jgi:hypothetical protein
MDPGLPRAKSDSLAGEAANRSEDSFFDLKESVLAKHPGNRRRFITGKSFRSPTRFPVKEIR